MQQKEEVTELLWREEEKRDNEKEKERQLGKGSLSEVIVTNSVKQIEKKGIGGGREGTGE